MVRFKQYKDQLGLQNLVPGDQTLPKFVLQLLRVKRL